MPGARLSGMRRGAALNALLVRAALNQTRRDWARNARYIRLLRRVNSACLT